MGTSLRDLDIRLTDLENRTDVFGRLDPALTLSTSLYSLGNVPAVRVTNSIAITTSSGGWVALTFDTTRFDTGELHSTATNTGRLTVSESGIYLVSSSILFANNSIGDRLLRIRRIQPDATSSIVALESRKASGGQTTGLSIETAWNAIVGDYFICESVQTSGDPLDIEKNNSYSPEFAMIKVAEIGQL